MFPHLIEFGWLQLWQFIAWSLSLVLHWRPISFQNEEYWITADDVMSDVNFQNTNFLYSFLVLIKTTKEESWRYVSSFYPREKHRQLMSFQSNWRLMLKAGVNTISIQLMQKLMLCWYHVRTRVCFYIIVGFLWNFLLFMRKLLGDKHCVILPLLQSIVFDT